MWLSVVYDWGLPIYPIFMSFSTVLFQIDFSPRFVIQVAFQPRALLYPALESNAERHLVVCWLCFSACASSVVSRALESILPPPCSLMRYNLCWFNSLQTASLIPHLLPSLHLVEPAEAQVLAGSEVSPSIVKISFEMNTSLVNCLLSVSTAAILLFGLSSSSATQETEQHLLTALASGTGLRYTLHLCLPNNLSLLVPNDLALCFQELDIWNIHSDSTQIPAVSCAWSTDQFYLRFLPQRDCHHSLYRDLNKSFYSHEYRKSYLMLIEK